MIWTLRLFGLFTCEGFPNLFIQKKSQQKLGDQLVLLFMAERTLRIKFSKDIQSFNDIYAVAMSLERISFNEDVSIPFSSYKQ